MAGSTQLAGGVLAELPWDDMTTEDLQGLLVPAPEDLVSMPSRAVVPTWDWAHC